MPALDLTAYIVFVALGVLLTVLGLKFRMGITMNVLSMMYGLMTLSYMVANYGAVQLSENGAVVQSYDWLSFVIFYVFISIIFPFLLILKDN